MQIFISHSDKDHEIAKALSSELSAAGMKVWLAEEQVLPGENLSLQIGKALQQSDAMVVLLSPEAVVSKYVRSEIAYALSSPKFEERVVPVVVKPTKNIPWFLQTLELIDAHGTHAKSIKKTAEKIVETLLETAKGDKVLERVLGKSKSVTR